MTDILLMTTPVPDEYKIVRNLGLITGVTCRTRGMGGKFVAGFQAMAGGEVSAFTSEMEKARYQALDRMKAKAVELGANAVAGIDIETSDVFRGGATLVCATGTALVLETRK